MLDNSAFTFDGFPDLPEIPVESDLPSQILKLADKNGPHFIKNISGEFSAGYIKDNSAYFTSNVGGTHPLFFTENDQLIAISNWMGILFGLPGVDDSFDFTGLSWICYERSMQD
ncbi:MAG: hypothetical protein JW920_11610, partial [Deltaproteobacteria bacterium]|nr:hypothetical protein [Deltaproteobacteria bacterium]